MRLNLQKQRLYPEWTDLHAWLLTLSAPSSLPMIRGGNRAALVVSFVHLLALLDVMRNQSLNIVHASAVVGLCGLAAKETGATLGTLTGA